MATYKFGKFEIDADERRFTVDGAFHKLAPRVFDTLLMLVENAGRVLAKEKMLEDIWQGSYVEENNLSQIVSLLRRTLGENSRTKFIETVPKFGYRFVADVERTGSRVEAELIERSRARIYIDDGSHEIHSTAAILDKLRPETRYARNGDVNIAYQVVGDGPVDVVFVMGWVSHLEYFWRHHAFASFLEKLTKFSRLILFDKRGTGLSDRVPLEHLPTLEQRMEDVHAVMDAVGSESAVLVGVSEGGPMCALFAATYPERTSGLVMIGTYAKRIRDDDYPWAPTEEQRNAFFELMQRDWGKPVGIDERAPSLIHDQEFRDWWAEYLRMGASPGAAVALTKMNAEIDVRDVLPLVRVPTLVIHRSGDMCLKVEEGRYVAKQIPNAKYVELGGIDHLPFVGDQDEILAEIEQFVSEGQFAVEHDRVLATVMSITFADAEGERKRRGEADWSAFVAASREFVRQRLKVFKGREVHVGDDETLAAFDGPARAIRCAIEINEAAIRQNVTLAIGLHTGECDVVGDTYSGVAVQLARHVRERSTDGNIIVSRTVKDLVAGSGLKFKELGMHTFEGVEGKWRLFRVLT
jgi:pimeloyl-ACP methyl ester carboxylesterase/DNA-binding winged helix-turn-helix (wHTH) protein/class 3 adenylate cyclase